MEAFWWVRVVRTKQRAEKTARDKDTTIKVLAHENTYFRLAKSFVEMIKKIPSYQDS